MDTSLYDPRAKDLEPPPYSADIGTGTVNSGYAPETPAPTNAEPDDTVVDVGFTARRLDEASVRRGFIRKVYLILTSQLAFTFGIVLLTTLWTPVAKGIRDNSWILYIFVGVFLVVYVVLVCSTKLRRQTPGNLIALFIFTLSMTAMASTLAAFTTSNAVLVSMGITGGVCIGVTLFVLQTRVDFTLVAGLIFGVSLVFALFGVSCLTTLLMYRGSLDPMSARILDCVYGGLIALLLVVCLVIDTHHVIGDSSDYRLSEEEYVFGALQLYMDVVLIFLFFLGVRGGR